MEREVKCIHCDGATHRVTGTVDTSGKRRMLKWTCPVTGKRGNTFLPSSGSGGGGKAPTTPRVEVHGGPGNDRIDVRVGSPGKGGGGGGGRDYAQTLQFRRVVNLDFDPRSILPFIVAVIEGMQKRGIGGVAPATAVARARAMLAEAMGEPTNGKRSKLADAGEDFAAAFGDALTALGITPAMWVSMYPAATAHALSEPGAAAAAVAAGGARGLTGLPDVFELLGEEKPSAPNAVVGAQPLDGDSPAFDAVERLSTGFAAGTVGASRGPVGAAAGAAAGFFAPELASAGEWVVNQLGLFGGSGGRANAAPGTSPIGRTSNPDAYRVVGGTPINP